MKKNQHQWLTIDEAAARMGCSTRTLQRRVADGKVVARRRDDGRVVMRVSIPTLLDLNEHDSDARSALKFFKCIEDRLSAIEAIMRDLIEAIMRDLHASVKATAVMSSSKLDEATDVIDRLSHNVHQTHAVQNNFCIRLGYIEKAMGIEDHPHRQHGDGSDARTSSTAMIEWLRNRVDELESFQATLDASGRKNTVLAALRGTGGDAVREACVPPFQNTGDRAGGESA